MSKLFTVSEVKEKIEALQEEWQEEANRLVNEARKEAFIANSKRNELLQVATQLAAGMNVFSHPEHEPADDRGIAMYAVLQAKHLIKRVDADCEPNQALKIDSVSSHLEYDNTLDKEFEQ